MAKVFFDAGITLDGFIAGENRGPDNPLGDGGTAIHNWMYKEKAFFRSLGLDGGKEETRDGEIIEEALHRTGSYVMGKRMFEEGEAHWPEDLYKTDVFVLTNQYREPWVQKGTTTFYFVNDGIQSALAKAKYSAKDKDVRIQGGADTLQQFLNAGLVDEFTLHVTPILLGKGIRLFDNVSPKIFLYEVQEVIRSPLTIHIKFTQKK